MQDIAYKQKYLKYKAKYLELKKGGGYKRLTFKEIIKKFNEIKGINDKLYFENTKNEIINISEKTNIHSLTINYEYTERFNGRNYKHNPSIEVTGKLSFIGDDTYGVEIISAKGSTNYILKVCQTECSGIAT